MLALLALLSCTPADAPVDQLPDYARASGSRAIRLTSEGARVDWQAPLPPEVTGIDGTWVLAAEEVPNPSAVPRRLKVVRALLPFNTPPGTPRPAGLEVTVAGTPVPFSKKKAAAAAAPSWRVNNRHLVLSLPAVPSEGELVVRWSAVAEALAPFRGERATVDRLPTSRTVGGVTRHGIVLPAPSSAEWDLDLPDGTTVLDTWLALPRAPLRSPSPDPASLILEVVDGGQSTEVGRRTLKRDKPGFVHWTADLSAWSGRSITLRLRADPHANPWWDWIFVGSPTVRAKPVGPIRRVVVVAIDTTRPDHLGFYGYDRPTTPELDRIAEHSITFDRTWSVAPRTRPAFRSAFTGRLPLDAVGAPNLAEHLQEAGWATAGIVANIHLQPRFDFDHGFDWWHYRNNADAKGQVDRALEWLGANADRDSFLFLHFMDPHMPYAAPGPYRDKFVTDPDPDLPAHYNRWTVNGWTRAGTITEQRKAHIEALHDGELAYTSAQIGRLVEALDALDGDTLLLLHTDHGEEFWEHGAFEHNHALFDESTRAVLWVRPGGGLRHGRRVAEPASLLDIAPTLIELLGLEEQPELDGRSLVPLLRDGAAPIERPIPVAYLQYGMEQWAVVWRGQKYVLHTGTGREELYDLTADPGEQQDRAAQADLGPWHKALAKAHEVDVLPGLRLFVEAVPEEPVAITFPAPVRAAGVLDPEATIEDRANLEWGEKPKKLPEDIGAVELSEDRTRLVYTPGPRPEGGVIWVQADAPIEARAVESSSAGALRVVAGTVLVPPPGEASRMRALRGHQAVAAEEMENLEALGYVEEAP